MNAAAPFLDAAIAAAPSAPRWFLSLIARAMAAPLSFDCRLLLADAIEEQSLAAALDGEITLAAQLHRLADLPRQTAAPARHFLGRDTWH